MFIMHKRYTDLEGRYIALVVGRFGPSESLRVQRTFQLIGQHGDVDVEAKYHVSLGTAGGAWLGPAYP